MSESLPVSRKISLLLRMEKQQEILQHKWAVLLKRKMRVLNVGKYKTPSIGHAS